MRNVLLERLLLQAVQRCLSPAAPGELGLRREERESVQTGCGGGGAGHMGKKTGSVPWGSVIVQC